MRGGGGEGLLLLLCCTALKLLSARVRKGRGRLAGRALRGPGGAACTHRKADSIGMHLPGAQPSDMQQQNCQQS